MKKIYIEPSVKAIKIKPIVMQTASLDIDTTQTINEGEENLIQSEEFGFSEEDEY